MSDEAAEKAWEIPVYEEGTDNRIGTMHATVGPDGLVRLGAWTRDRDDDPTEVGQVWRHKASGDEYMRSAWVNADGVETQRFWKRLSFGIIGGRPRGLPRDRFLEEFELIGVVDEEGNIDRAPAQPE